MIEYAYIGQNHPRLVSTRLDSAMNTRHPHRVRRGTKWQPRKSTAPFSICDSNNGHLPGGERESKSCRYNGRGKKLSSTETGSRQKGVVSQTTLSLFLCLLHACILSLSFSLLPSLLPLSAGFAHATGPERTTLYLTGAHRKIWMLGMWIKSSSSVCPSEMLDPELERRAERSGKERVEEEYEKEGRES